MSTEPTDLRGLASDYVERIRLPWERKLEAQGSSFAVWPALSARRPAGVPLTEELAPRVHRLASEVAASLRSNQRYVFFQCQGLQRVFNAQALTIGGDAAIELVGPVARLLTDDGLRALIGHEMGHHLAHGPVAKPPSRILLLSGDPRGSRLASMASELTADRFALLASRSFKACVEIEMVGETGEPFPERSNVDEIAEQCRKLVQSRQVALMGHTHPTSTLRIYAHWLFWQSDVYRRLTGLGPGTIALDEINTELEYRMTTPSFPTVEPPPTSVTKPPSRKPRMDLQKRFAEFVSRKPSG